eukprot:3296951-Alexandrium_andersonii.AAC.1
MPSLPGSKRSRKAATPPPTGGARSSARGPRTSGSSAAAGRAPTPAGTRTASPLTSGRKRQRGSLTSLAK